MSSKYAVIFDMDGVLVDSENYFFKLNVRFVKDRGKAVVEKDLQKLVGMQMQGIYETLYEYFKGEMSFEQFKADYDTFCKINEPDYSTILNPGVIKTLESLYDRGFKIGLASSCDMHNIQKVLSQCNLLKYFTVIVSGDEFVVSKPNPQIYFSTANRLGIEPKYCFVVEDSVYGIEAGKRAGMTVFACKQPFGHDQSRADYIVDCIDEIIDIIDCKI